MAKQDISKPLYDVERTIAEMRVADDAAFAAKVRSLPPGFDRAFMDAQQIFKASVLEGVRAALLCANGGHSARHTCGAAGVAAGMILGNIPHPIGRRQAVEVFLAHFGAALRTIPENDEVAPEGMVSSPMHTSPSGHA